MFSKCARCGAKDRELGYQPVVTGQSPTQIKIARICETCVEPVISELRGIVASSGNEELLKLVTLLEQSGMEISEERTGGEESIDGTRRGVLTLLDSLERQVVCSGCYAKCPESRINITPSFNEELGQFVQAYRCAECFPATIANTIDRIQSSDDQAYFDQLGVFFQMHSIFIHEWLRGDAPSEVRPVIVHMLGMIADGSTKLKVGTTQPLKEKSKAGSWMAKLKQKLSGN